MIASKSVLWALLLAPAAWLGWHTYQLASGAVLGIGPLGADPVEYIVRFLGEWGLRILLVSLFISSLARRLRKAALVRYRRLVGLFAFAYLSAHFAAYVWLLAEARWAEVLADFTDRPYITVGLMGWIALVPLAVTSTRGWQRSLGRRWKRLHQLVYGVVIAGLVHWLWLTKDGYGEVLLYAVVAALLLTERLWSRNSSRRPVLPPNELR